MYDDEREDGGRYIIIGLSYFVQVLYLQAKKALSLREANR